MKEEISRYFSLWEESDVSSPSIVVFSLTASFFGEVCPPHQVSLSMERPALTVKLIAITDYSFGAIASYNNCVEDEIFKRILPHLWTDEPVFADA